MNNEIEQSAHEWIQRVLCDPPVLEDEDLEGIQQELVSFIGDLIKEERNRCGRWLIYNSKGRPHPEDKLLMAHGESLLSTDNELMFHMDRDLPRSK